MDSIKNILKTFKHNEAAISTFLGALVVLVTGVLLFNYFRSSSTPMPEISEEADSTQAMVGEVELVEVEDGVFTPKNLPTTHTVSTGDHLWSISERYYGNGYNWVDIAQANNINNPNEIEAGTSLDIPKTALRYTQDVKSKADMDLLSATSYTVQKGDNLWEIATRAYGDGYQWVEIYQANRNQLSSPDLLEIDMVLNLPR